MTDTNRKDNTVNVTHMDGCPQLACGGGSVGPCICIGGRPFESYTTPVPPGRPASRPDLWPSVTAAARANGAAAANANRVTASRLLDTHNLSWDEVREWGRANGASKDHVRRSHMSMRTVRAYLAAHSAAGETDMEVSA